MPVSSRARLEYAIETHGSKQVCFACIVNSTRVFERLEGPGRMKLDVGPCSSAAAVTRAQYIL